MPAPPPESEPAMTRTLPRMGGNILCFAAVPAELSRPLFAYRELVRLFARRLGETFFGRLARLASLSITLLSVLMIGVVRATEGPGAATAKIAANAAEISMWLVAVAIALAASHQRSLADRKDGIEMLALARGFDGAHLSAVRAGAASWLAFRWMLLPVAASALASAVSSGTLGVLGARLLVVVGLVLFTFIASVVLGVLGASADAVSPRRGRGVFLMTLLLSALFAEVARDPALSVTGGLATVLNGLLHAAGAGELA